MKFRKFRKERQNPHLARIMGNEVYVSSIFELHNFFKSKGITEEDNKVPVAHPRETRIVNMIDIHAHRPPLDTVIGRTWIQLIERSVTCKVYKVCKSFLIM